MSESNIYKTYAHLLKWHQKGHALWEPIRADRIRLGSVGYFDKKGRWETIMTSLHDTPPKMQPFTNDVNFVAESGDTARDFTSRNLEGTDFKFQLSFTGASVAIPAQVEAVIERGKRRQAFAFLHCDRLRSDRIKVDFLALKEWGKENARHILAAEPATREFGFFVVTAIHRVEGCQLKCWTNETRSIAPKVGAGASMIPVSGEAGVNHVTDVSYSGWVVRPSADDLSLVNFLCVEANDMFANPEYIVFVEGFHFASYAYGLYTYLQEDVIWRGSNFLEEDDSNSSSNDVDVELDDDDKTYKIVCEGWISSEEGI